MKNKKDDNKGRFDDHDYFEYYKNARKGEKRKKRHRVNEHIRDFVQGKMTPDEYEEYYGDYDYEE